MLRGTTLWQRCIRKSLPHEDVLSIVGGFVLIIRFLQSAGKDMYSQYLQTHPHVVHFKSWCQVEESTKVEEVGEKEIEELVLYFYFVDVITIFNKSMTGLATMSW